MSATKIALMALGAAGLGIAALAAFAGGPKRPDVEPDADALPALVVTSAELAAHRAARPIIEEAGRLEMGRALTPAELQYIGGVAHRETSYGRGWHGAMATANNWGAVQCDPSKMPESTCVPGQKDHGSGNVEFTTGFRRYATPVDGARHTVAHVLKYRPRTAAALAETSPKVHRASFAMRRERYYGGFCPKASAAHGVQAAEASFAHPDRDTGTQACEREAETSHADAIFASARAIAQALGEPLALGLGTYDDARAWWMRGGGVPTAGHDERPRVIALAAPHWDTTENAG